MEREVLVRVLRHTDGNQLQAARILGITRGSLRNKIRAWASASPGRSGPTTTRVTPDRPGPARRDRFARSPGNPSDFLGISLRPA